MSIEQAFSLSSGEGYTLIELSGVLDYNHCKEFEAIVPSISKSAHVFVDCMEQVALPKDWLRVFLRIQLNLKHENKTVRLINVNTTLLNYLKKEGIDTALKISKDLKEALHDIGVSHKKSLDTEFINPFLSATIHVLKVQAQIEAKPGQVQVKKGSDATFGDISGIIGIVSESFNGSVVISFPENTFLKIISNMLGETYTEINKDIVDGAGELTNMIFGQAKIVLNEKGYGIQTAIPSVVSGKNHTLSALTKGPVVVVPFESEAGNFFVEICLSN